MIKSGNDTAIVGSFGITPVKTCIGAGACKNGCYACSGRYLFKNVKNKMSERYELTLTDNFIPVIDTEIKKLVVKNPTKTVYIRIHDTGDFYNSEYVEKWFKVMELNPTVKFYAYTKSIVLFKVFETMPDNFKVIYSYGGIHDELINPDVDPNARVFGSLDELLKAGYVDCSDNDLLVFTTDKVGLVYHGSKKYENTGFNQN